MWTVGVEVPLLRLVVPKVLLMGVVLDGTAQMDGCCGARRARRTRRVWYSPQYWAAMVVLAVSILAVRTWCSLALTVSTTLSNEYSWYLPAILVRVLECESGTRRCRWKKQMQRYCTLPPALQPTSKPETSLETWPQTRPCTRA